MARVEQRDGVTEIIARCVDGTERVIHDEFSELAPLGYAALKCTKITALAAGAPDGARSLVVTRAIHGLGVSTMRVKEESYELVAAFNDTKLAPPPVGEQGLLSAAFDKACHAAGLLKAQIHHSPIEGWMKEAEKKRKKEPRRPSRRGG